MTKKDEKLKEYEVVFEGTAKIKAESMEKAGEVLLQKENISVCRPLHIIGEDVTKKNRKLKFNLKFPSYGFWGILALIYLIVKIAVDNSLLVGFEVIDKLVLVIYFIMFSVGGCTRKRYVFE